MTFSLKQIGEGLLSLNKSVEGILCEINSIQDVLSLLKELKAEEERGTLEAKIVLVEDAGTTTLAPVLSKLKGVVCTSGALGSHLAIVTREFGIPALMGTTLDYDGELSNQRVRIEPREGTSGVLLLIET
ncbi:MAG: PEP-utilizing enzyme [Candidatus Hodarchaeota archaeon]